MKQYITVEEHGKDGGVFCTGIFADWASALKQTLNSIIEFHTSYNAEGDIFEYSEPFMMDGEGGWCVIVKYKAACWTHLTEPLEHYYYILFHNSEEDKNEDRV